MSKLFLIPAVLGGLLIALAGCKDEPADNASDEPHVYYYYPKPNIYLDSTSSNFIRFDSATKNWQEQPVASITTDLGKSVRIDSPYNPVWTNNGDHRTTYSVMLYRYKADLK